MAGSLDVYLTNPAATQGNATAQADPNASLGEYLSTTALDDGTPQNNLWDNVSAAENAASDVEYRAVAVRNMSAVDSVTAIVGWISAETAGGADLAIGVDPAAASPIGQVAAQGEVVADESTAPTGVTFTAPTVKASGISVGTLAGDETRLVWFRRSATNSASLAGDGATVTFEGDTV